MEVSEDELKNMTPEQIAELQKQNCIFCQLGSGKVPAKTVYEDEELFAVLDINPATPGHILLIPKEHYAIMPQVPEHIIERMFMVAKGLSQSILKALSAKGTTIFVANGMVAGQRAPHVMMHVIPRVEGDGIGLEIPKGAITESQIKAITERLGPLVQQHLGESKEQEAKPEVHEATLPELTSTTSKPLPPASPNKGIEPIAKEEITADQNGKVATVGVKKDKDYLYYVDRDGDISRKKLVRGKKTKETTSDVNEVDEILDIKNSESEKKPEPEEKKKDDSGLEDLTSG